MPELTHAPIELAERLQAIPSRWLLELFLNFRGACPACLSSGPAGCTVIHEPSCQLAALIDKIMELERA